MFGLGWAEWLTIIGLVGGLILTFRIMARASLAYAKAREAREKQALVGAAPHEATGGPAGPDPSSAEGDERP